MIKIKCKFCGHHEFRKHGYKYRKNRKTPVIQCKKCKNYFTKNSLLEKGVKCAICKISFLSIQPAHLSRHNLTIAEYKIKFPQCSLKSKKTLGLMSLCSKERQSKPENRKKFSKFMKNWYKNNPGKVRRLQENRMKVLKSTYFRQLRSKQMKAEYKKDPTRWIKGAKTLKKTLSDPKIKKKISLSIKASRRRHPHRYEKAQKKRLKTVRSKEYRRKQSTILKRFHKEHPEARKNQAKKLSKWIKRNPNKWNKAVEKSAKTRRSLEFRNKTSRKVKGYIKKHPEFRKMVQERARNMWKDEDTVNKMIKNLNVKPNKSEQKLIQILHEERLPYRFVGDFKLMLNGRNPDFIHIGNKNKLIELFGEYWHTERRGLMNKKEIRLHVADRKSHFRELGYDTLIIWEKELKNSSRIVQKIRSF